MHDQKETYPALVIEYHDHEEGFYGWFVRHSLRHRICAGGMRVQRGLTREHMINMAANMSRKMAIASLHVDGAKCGIDYDPENPGKEKAMHRFLASIRPYIAASYSMGPDLNVSMEQLERIIGDLGLLSPKIAIARAQGWTDQTFISRTSLLCSPLDGGWNLGNLRAGYGVAGAVMAVLKKLDIPFKQARVTVQGFGQLAKAAIHTLHQSGVSITAIADAKRAYVNQNGLPIDELLTRSTNTLLPDIKGVTTEKRDALYQVPSDIFIPAALENVITEENCSTLHCRAIVPGANLAVNRLAAKMLHNREIIVIPDFVAGCGGSLSMEGLYGPSFLPRPEDVLSHVKEKMWSMIDEILAKSKEANCTPLDAALAICACRDLQSSDRPYCLETSNAGPFN